MLKVVLNSASGQSYVLTEVQGRSPVLAPEDALRDLVGKSERVDMPVPGRSGVIPGRTRFGAIQAEVPFFLSADSGAELERVHREFRQGWSRSVPSTFVVEADRGDGPWMLPVVLDGVLPGAGVDVRARTSMTLQVPVVSPVGLFCSPVRTGTGSVTVTNHGDVVVYPKIVNSGSGGRVVSPSGAEFTLPPASEAPTIDLDPRQLKTLGVFPEGVEPGRTGVWVLPEGASLRWRIYVADPWA